MRLTQLIRQLSLNIDRNVNVYMTVGYTRMFPIAISVKTPFSKAKRTPKHSCERGKYLLEMKMGDLKMHQLAWVTNITRIVPLAARQ
jgi:hypothetical protein